MSRTVLTVSAVSISAAFVTILLLAGRCINDYINQQVLAVPSNRQMIITGSAKQELSAEQIRKLAEETGASDIRTTYLFCYTIIKGENLLLSSRNASAVFYDEAQPLFTRAELQAANADGTVPMNGVLISESLLHAANMEPESAIGSEITVVLLDKQNNKAHKEALPVDGIIPDELLAYMPAEQTAEIYIPYSGFQAIPHSVGAAALEYSDADAALSANGVSEKYGFVTRIERDQIMNARSEKNIYQLIFSFSVGIVLIASVLFISNSVSITFREKQRHYGMLKAVGFSHLHIWCICFFQGIVMSLAGGLIGTLTAQIVYRISAVSVFHVLMDTEALQSGYQSDLASSGWVVLLLAAAGIVSGLLPAFRASRQNVVRSLSYEQ